MILLSVPHRCINIKNKTYDYYSATFEHDIICLKYREECEISYCYVRILAAWRNHYYLQ